MFNKLKFDDKQFRDELINLLGEIKEILDKNRVTFWLDYGTLLGAVRDNKLIPWDNDIEIGTWDSELDKIDEAIDDFHKKKLKVHFTESDHVTIKKYGGNFRKKISMMVYSLKGDKAVRGSFTNMAKIKTKEKNGEEILKMNVQISRSLKYLRWLLTPPEFIGDPPAFIPSKIHHFAIEISIKLPRKMRNILKKIIETIMKIGCRYFEEVVPPKYFKDLENTKFYNMDIKVPRDKESYLEYRYGKDWRVPKKKFTWYKDLKKGEMLR